MVVILPVAAVAALYGLVRGGSLEGLANTPFRFVWLLFAGLIAQVGVGIWDPPWLSETGELVVVLGSNAVVAVFLALNRHLPGMRLAALGLVLNIAVIAPNGAMPVSLDAAELAGKDAPTELGLKHEAMNDDTVFPWLGDVIPLPGMRTLLSVGDVVLAAGIAWLVYRRTVTASDEAEEARTEEASG